MHKVTKLLASALLCAAPAAAQPEAVRQVVEIMVEDAASPWSKRDGTGFANEVVIAALSAMNIDVKLTVVPYVRCKKAVLRGDVPACFSMSPLHEPEYQTRVRLASQPLIWLNADVFENADNPLPRPVARSCELPKGAVVGVVRGYEYPPETMALARAGAVFQPVNSDHHSLKMLAAGRIDAAIVITNDLEPRNQKALESHTADDVRFSFACGQETGTIGFSLKHPQGPWLREMYEQGHRRIDQNGKLSEIASRWGQRRDRRAD
jgi:polar amino acid transport system substrate-binding protein